MQIPLAFSDPVVIEEVSLPLWRELFDAVGWPTSLSGKGESLTHDDIVSAFHRDTLSGELLYAIESILDLGTPEGRETINTLLADRQILPSTLPQGLGERELALCLFISQRNDGALAEVFARAQIQMQEGSHRRFNDFIGKEPKRIRDLSAKGAELECAILEHCQQEDLGSYVQLRVFDDDDGACRFQIMRSHHTRAPLAVMDGATSRAKIQYRPVHADFLRYEPELGRLRITARAASIVQFYRKIFGRVLFEDEAFFGGKPICSFKVLQEKGRAALENHAVFGVGRVWMTECVWERGDRERLNFFHPYDCFDSIERLEIPLTEGQILQAKFKIQVIERSKRPVTVTVRVPRQIEVSQPKHESLINEVLDAIGIRNIHATAPEYDLWTLYPWRQPVGAWRDCFGASTDFLVTKGILKTTRLDSVVPPGHPGAGRILQVEQISSVEYLGVSKTPEIPSQSLSATDLSGLELIVPAFQNHLREVFDITGGIVPWQTDSWFLDLGVLSICEHEFRMTYALRQPPRDAAAQIRTLSASIAPVLLLPKGMKGATGITEIFLDKALPDRQRVVKDIIIKANLEGQVPALLIAPKNARLVVDTRLGKIWFDRIEITELKPGTQAFRFVVMLAKNCPATVNKYALSEQLSASRTDGDQAARSAKTTASKLIKAALKAKSLGFEDPFKSENGSYRLIVTAYAPDIPSQSETEKALIQTTA